MRLKRTRNDKAKFGRESKKFGSSDIILFAEGEVGERSGGTSNVVQMKIPKTRKKYCPYCRKHTEHKIARASTKPRPKTKKGALKWGARHQFFIESGYGGFPKPIVHDKAKTSKKLGLEFECMVCKKTHHKMHPRRLKKLEQK